MQRKSTPNATHDAASAQTGSRGSQVGTQRLSAPLPLRRQAKSVGHTGASGSPVHRAAQVPWLVSSRFQHIAPSRQSSAPVGGSPGASALAQGSPGAWSPVMGTHWALPHESLPSGTAAHFWSGGQSWAKGSQSRRGPGSGLP